MPESIPLDLVGYNHTDRSIYAFGVDGQGGPYIDAHKGGGNFTCCASVPRTYRPGMTMKVEWVNGRNDVPQQRTVPVPPYRVNEIGTLSVHFLRDGDIKVFVTMMTLWHPHYPLKGDEARL